MGTHLLVQLKACIPQKLLERWRGQAIDQSLEIYRLEVIANRLRRMHDLFLLFEGGGGVACQSREQHEVGLTFSICNCGWLFSF